MVPAVPGDPALGTPLDATVDVAGTKVHAEDVLRSADELVAGEYRARIIATNRSFV